MDNSEFIRWCGGFFDGEGTIGTTVDNRNTLKNYALYMSLAQCNEDILNRWKGMFGGVVRKITSYPDDGYIRRQKWEWRISGRKVIEVLKDLMPFLILKLKQAELAMKFGETYGAFGHAISGETREKRRILDIEFRKEKRLSDIVKLPGKLEAA